MCGIAGYRGNLNQSQLSKMLETISHRGPDDTGSYFYKNIGLGHKRLSIIDLSNAGHQPMFSLDKKITIVFNGEIYNYQQIKADLIKKKYEFSSNTDTEVIIYLYQLYGTNCLKYLRGMFSFVIYDKEKDILFGARDRVGEKPLVYCHQQNNFIFASEVKAILKVIENKEIDEEAINHFLTLQYIPTPLTGFKNIYKLPPGHYFILRNNKLDVKRYWDIDFNCKEKLSEEEWQEKIIVKLEESIKMRMMSDVNLGALLSGGTDSSAVVALMARNSTRQIKTFSIGFDDHEYDETMYAQKISDMYDTDHTVLKLKSESLIQALPMVFTYYDQPIADNSVIPTFLLSKLVKKHITVALDGDGGDENFAGYDRYQFLLATKYLNNPKINSSLKFITNIFYKLKPSLFSSRAVDFASSLSLPFNRKYQHYNKFFGSEKKNILLWKTKIDTFDLYQNLSNKTADLLDKALYTDIMTYLPDDLLYKVDIASMAFGLELRAPFLDHEFMEMAASIPSSLKIKNGQKKYILAKALVDGGILPKEVVYRKKKGFNFPLKKWLRYELKDYVIDTIGSSKMISQNLINKKSLDLYLQNYYQSGIGNSNNIFALLSLAEWTNRYF